ncbi:glycosyltransferase 87 family protein [Chloroflexus sp. Y-396-1]|uniref:glycosyltransferase 87 family protein n=1 Tax=Chloroflexus sp. Y-396-1 TaxID=867845 RepID=UPI0004908257|nr:glycosyltransferase 87 family protein [Chloroflexus sp. Y-396-1]
MNRIITSLANIILGIVVLILAIAALAIIPLPIPIVADFWMLYNTAYGLVRGVYIYDYTAQSSIAYQVFGDLLQDITLPYYVYPPWFIYSFFFLGLFPPDYAAQFWFWCNIAIIGTTLHLITNSWSFRSKIYAILFTLSWSSIWMLLIVGQFIAPLMLGIALIMFAITHSQPSLLVVGMFLLTYKPHLDGFIFIFVVGWLLFKRYYKPLKVIIFTHISICIIFLIINPLWLLDYIRTLIGFREQTTFTTCDDCSSGATLLVSAMTGKADTATALYVGIGIALVGTFIWWLVFQWRLDTTIEVTIYWSSVLALLSIPYVNNYDSAMLLLSFLWLTNTAKHTVTKTFLTIALVVPWIGVVLSDRPIVAVLLASSACSMAFALLFEVYLNRLKAHSM